MKTVYLVQHVRGSEESESDVKIVGVYSSRAAADGAVATLVLKPGFSDCPTGFHVDEYVVDRVYWQDGFSVVSR